MSESALLPAAPSIADVDLPDTPTTQNPDRPLPTKREWLAQQGLAKSLDDAKRENKRPGGRLSNAAKERLEAELKNPNGQRFSD